MATPQQIVALLNEFQRAEPDAAHRLVEHRESCRTEDLAAHPTIVVADGGVCDTIGLLGIINGIVGLDGELVEAVYNDVTETLTGFRLRAK